MIKKKGLKRGGCRTKPRCVFWSPLAMKMVHGGTAQCTARMARDLVAWLGRYEARKNDGLFSIWLMAIAPRRASFVPTSDHKENEIIVGTFEWHNLLLGKQTFQTLERWDGARCFTKWVISLLQIDSSFQVVVCTEYWWWNVWQARGTTRRIDTINVHFYLNYFNKIRSSTI